MPSSEVLLQELYDAFNRRDIDAALTRMTEDVHWPKASEGSHVIGKDGIRSYWTRQWSEFQPIVHPLRIEARPDGGYEVTVHQVVRSLAGEVLSDLEVLHTFTLANDLIARMDLDESVSAFHTDQGA